MSELKKMYTTDRSKKTFVRDLQEMIYKYEHDFQSLQRLKVNFSSGNSCHRYSSCICSAAARERKRDAQRSVGREKEEREREKRNAERCLERAKSKRRDRVRTIQSGAT